MTERMSSTRCRGISENSVTVFCDDLVMRVRRIYRLERADDWAHSVFVVFTDEAGKSIFLFKFEAACAIGHRSFVNAGASAQDRLAVSFERRLNTRRVDPTEHVCGGAMMPLNIGPKANPNKTSNSAQALDEISTRSHFCPVARRFESVSVKRNPLTLHFDS